MKLQGLALATTALSLASSASADNHARRGDHLHKRQGTATTGTPPLASLTKDMPNRPELLPTSTYAPGTKAPVSGAPVLPKTFVKNPSAWPAPDQIPPTDSPEVRQWLKELEGVDIPNLSLTVDPSNAACVGNPEAAANAAQRGWWTCGGHTRPSDIVACPDKLTWGLSFDDGPSPYTQYLLNYLDSVNLSATFFLVGSRVVDRPTLVLEEYMKGHELSVHTWSHKGLTSLTNEQIVAELGWTRKAIKDVTGVAPTTMRPPFGDIDDRVRAITLAMGMVPIMWSQTTTGGSYDTNDWKIPGGVETGVESFEAIKKIVEDASKMETGFIVLQHDLYDSSVHMGVGYTLPYAQNFSPKMTLMPIGQCVKKPTTDLYFESNTNKTFPPAKAVRSVAESGSDTDGNSAIGRYSFSVFAAVAGAAVAAAALL